MQIQLSFNTGPNIWAFPDGTSGKEPDCQCRRLKRRRFDPWVGKIPWRRAWQPTLYPCLENLMDRGAWQATALQRVAHDWNDLAYPKCIFQVSTNIFFNWHIIASQCCVSAVQRRGSAICIRVSRPSPPHPPRSSQSTKLGSLCAPWRRFPLAFYFTHGSVFMFTPNLTVPNVGFFSCTDSSKTEMWAFSWFSLWVHM